MDIYGAKQNHASIKYYVKYGFLNYGTQMLGLCLVARSTNRH